MWLGKVEATSYLPVVSLAEIHPMKTYSDSSIPVGSTTDIRLIESETRTRMFLAIGSLIEVFGMSLTFPFPILC